jgi:hypothetical protein
MNDEQHELSKYIEMLKCEPNKISIGFNPIINMTHKVKEPDMTVNNIFNIKLERAVLLNGTRIDTSSPAQLIGIIQDLTTAFDTLEALDLEAEVVQAKLMELDDAIMIVTELLNDK